jgi:hypothetical protein
MNYEATTNTYNLYSITRGMSAKYLIEYARDRVSGRSKYTAVPARGGIVTFNQCSLREYLDSFAPEGISYLIKKALEEELGLPALQVNLSEAFLLARYVAELVTRINDDEILNRGREDSVIVSSRFFIVIGGVFEISISAEDSKGNKTVLPSQNFRW